MSRRCSVHSARIRCPAPRPAARPTSARATERPMSRAVHAGSRSGTRGRPPRETMCGRARDAWRRRSVVAASRCASLRTMRAPSHRVEVEPRRAGRAPSASAAPGTPGRAAVHRMPARAVRPMPTHRPAVPATGWDPPSRCRYAAARPAGRRRWRPRAVGAAAARSASCVSSGSELFSRPSATHGFSVSAPAAAQARTFNRRSCAAEYGIRLNPARMNGARLAVDSSVRFCVS